MILSDNKNVLIQNKIYDYLKEQIISNNFQVGQLYSETKLSKELGVSRSPFRYALQRLTQEGYIVIEPSKGFRIRELTYKDIHDTIQVRCAIEGFCIYEVINCRDRYKKETLFNELESIIADLKNIIKTTRNIDDFVKKDHLFHLKMIEFVDNIEFINIYKKLIYLISLTSRNTLYIDGRMETTLNEHENIFRNLKKGYTLIAFQDLMAHLQKPLHLLNDKFSK